jgi:benzodiazapine receptor
VARPTLAALSQRKQVPARGWLPRTAAAVTAVAVAGSVSVIRGMPWYDRLDKPSWQPPRQAFGLVWTPLYGMLAVAGARLLSRAPADTRPALLRAYSANLIANGAWTPLFFGARAPRLALADIILLDISTMDLLRRARSVDRTAAALLLPYLAWVTFATALNAEIAHRNP